MGLQNNEHIFNDSIFKTKKSFSKSYTTSP